MRKNRRPSHGTERIFRILGLVGSLQRRFFAIVFWRPFLTDAWQIRDKNPSKRIDDGLCGLMGITMR